MLGEAVQGSGILRYDIGVVGAIASNLYPVLAHSRPPLPGIPSYTTTLHFPAIERARAGAESHHF
jgi:hypothetical protein